MTTKTKHLSSMVRCRGKSYAKLKKFADRHRISMTSALEIVIDKFDTLTEAEKAAAIIDSAAKQLVPS